MFMPPENQLLMSSIHRFEQGAQGEMALDVVFRHIFQQKLFEPFLRGSVGKG
jgi:hypothetical protein